MPFKFSGLCELLEELSRNRYQQRATNWKQQRPDHRLIREWYNKYNDKIDHSGPGAVAFLSALFPERRPDRTYHLQEKRLSHIFGHALGLGAARLRDLLSWSRVDGQDFPTCVQRIMSECEFDPPATGYEVTLEEIDDALTQIAANTISSAPAIRARANEQSPVEILKPIIRRLRSHEAKWLVRMIQKSYSPVEIPEYATLHGFHFMLPKLLEIQNCFEAAVETLSNPELARFRMLPCEDEAGFMASMGGHISPQLGLMVRRQSFFKARSIKHCVKMAESRTMSIERKHDGEYCQVHIDISKGSKCIQIFSKNGRNSTEDRLGLQDAIKAGLRLGMPECKVKSRAILEGELLVYSNSQKAILPFYHIRKHVRHGGRRIGTEKDLTKKAGESLMVVFYDVLLLDEKVLLTEPHRKRRAHLKALVTPIEGYIEIVERAMIDFGSRQAPEVLRSAFGTAIRKRWEGFVLKGLEDPYFAWKRGTQCIKLKKDYISGLGDSADLCIIGGRRDPRIETELGLGRLPWTIFYVAALVNKDDVRRHSMRPILRILDCLGPGSMSKDDILALNSEGKLVEQDYVAESTFMVLQHTRTSILLPTQIFTRPLVVEVMGAGYERPESADFWVLRFPRRVGSKLKLHRDRDIVDTVSFDELQVMAQESLKNPEEAASQEEMEWVQRLLAADPKPAYCIDKSQSTSPAKTLRSETTVELTPAGPRRSSTQRSLVVVRMDSEELDVGELLARHTESCPDFRTPSRHSVSTATPSASGQSGVPKRDFAAMEDSHLISASRKRQRVAFADTVRDLQPKPLLPLDNFPFQPPTAGQHSRRDNGKAPAKSSFPTHMLEKNAPKGETLRSSTTYSPLPEKLQPRPHLASTISAHLTPPFSAEHAQQLERERRSRVLTGPRHAKGTALETVGRPYSTTINSTVTARPFSLQNNLTWISPLAEDDEEKIQLVLEASGAINRTYTRSLQTFIQQSVDQFQLPVEDRLQCAALIDFSTPEMAASHIRALAKEVAKSEVLAANLTSEASVFVYDFNVLKTFYSQSESSDVHYERSDTVEHDCFCGTLRLLRKTDGIAGRTTLKLKMVWSMKVRDFEEASYYWQTHAALHVLG